MIDYWATHRNLFALTNQDSTIFYTRRNSKIFNLTSTPNKLKSQTEYLERTFNEISYLKISRHFYILSTGFW